MAEKETPEALELRARPRPVVRLNRRSLVIATAVLASAVMGMTWWALRGRGARQGAPEELHDLDRVAQAEGLTALPHDYAKLGPPLGELGRPILKREEGRDRIDSEGSFGANPEEDAARTDRMKDRQEAEQASHARVFFQVNERRKASSASKLNSDEKTLDPAPVENNSGIYASGTIQMPKSPFELMAGSIIPAALVTALNSDLPGPIVATVTENVYDTVSGGALLVPQGARLLGQYEHAVGFGQSRLMFVWTRLLMPDGSSIVLDRLSGVDAQGAAGVEDQVDRHWDRIFAGAAVTTLLAAGAELAAPDTVDGDRVVIAARRSVQDSVTDVGQQLTRKSLEIQPTVTIRAGFPVRAIVNRDIVLRDYGQQTKGPGS